MRIMAGSVSDLPILTLQNPADAQGPLLPVSLQRGDLGMFTRLRPEVSASVAVPPWEEGPSIGDQLRKIYQNQVSWLYSGRSEGGGGRAKVHPPF